MEKQIMELVKALMAIRTAIEIEDEVGAEHSVNALGKAEDAVLEAIEVVLHCSRVYTKS